MTFGSEAKSIDFSEYQIVTSKDTFRTNRTLSEYCDNLNLSPDVFRGKKVLDLGSGAYTNFARQIKDLLQEEVFVVSFDFLHGSGAYPNTAPQHAVAGYFSKLPFKDESFDSIVSSYAFPLYLRSKPELAVQGWQEVIRTLKPGGEAKCYPVHPKEIPLLEELVRREKMPVVVEWKRDRYKNMQVGMVTIHKIMNSTI